MESFNFKHTLSEQDYANLLVFIAFERKKFNKIFLLYVMPVLGLLFLAFFLFYFDTIDIFGVLLSLFIMVFGWGIKLLYVLVAKKSYRKSDLLKMENDVTFTEEGINASSERGSSQFFYTDFSQVHENKEYFYISIGSSHIISFSKEQIGTDISNKIREVFTEKIPDKYKKSN